MLTREYALKANALQRRFADSPKFGPRHSPLHVATGSRRPHWYRIHIGECPVCGRDQTYRERVYGKRPKSHARRYVYKTDSGYCGCMRV